MVKLASGQKRNRRGPQLDADWRERYLKALETVGAKWRAARVAGIAKRTVDAYEAADPVFAAEAEDARQLYYDDCVVELRRIGREKHNPLPLFGILRAGRRDEWNDQVVMRSVSLSVNVDASPADARELVARMFASVTAATRARLSAPEGRPSPDESEDTPPPLNGPLP